MKAGIATLGCKVNQYESQVMMDMLCAHGFEQITDGQQADVFIVNSCTVTGTSDKKVRQTVRRARREHPDAVMILTGCMPQAFPKECEAIEEADIVIGNANRDRLLNYIEDFMRSHQRTAATASAPTASFPMRAAGCAAAAPKKSGRKRSASGSITGKWS